MLACLFKFKAGNKNGNFYLFLPVFQFSFRVDFSAITESAITKIQVKTNSQGREQMHSILEPHAKSLRQKNTGTL